jgi:phosphoribosylformimino-5-aminoimidazole carboxamide ribotide isomerase
MQVIPVIDILNCKAVHAVRGARSQYKPIQSILSQSTQPKKIAEALKKEGFKQLYIADLDAIIDCTKHDFSLLKEIAQETSLKIMVDAGITSIDRAQSLLDSGVELIVVGTETLKTKGFVKEAIERFGREHVIVSLDLKAGKVITQQDFDGCTDPICLLKEFKAMGVSQIIVLDLARVGSGEGIDTTFLKQVIAEVGVEVYVGGGVRNVEDLEKLNAACIKGALVATALHTGKISVPDLKTHGFL